MIEYKNECSGDGMTGIANHAKKSEYEEFGEAVKSVSSSICGLVEAAAQAAYLVGVSEPSSVAGRPGLVDQAQFARAAQSIQTACQHLTNPTTNQQQVFTSFLNVPVTVLILFSFSYLVCVFGFP
jgi:talin